MREYVGSLNKSHSSGGAKDIVRSLVQDNKTFVRTHKPAYFSHFLDSQHPRATVVTCSDSRVHTHALDATPDGDLFMVRNIGNQIATAEGSVEYGVHHLHTPLLLIVGHVACGAIKAASGDYSKESPFIKRELDSIQIPKGDSGLSGVKTNVNNQVRHAVGKFEEEVTKGSLTVIGAVYDFKDEMRQGQGKLHIINVNGENDPRRIAALEIMQGLDAPDPHAVAAHAPRAPRPVAKPKPAAPVHEEPAEEAKPLKKSMIKLPEKPKDAGKDAHKADEPKVAGKKKAAAEDEEDPHAKPAKKAEKH
ncbi:MAG: carbonic anhydrase [Betaproteobacteria bacterium]|nr:carbonic anhydrase [Betaproteobacteria bacterium]